MFLFCNLKDFDDQQFLCDCFQLSAYKQWTIVENTSVTLDYMQRSMCRIQKNHNNKFTVFYTNKRLVIKMKKSLETVLTGEINKENKFLNLE